MATVGALTSRRYGDVSRRASHLHIRHLHTLRGRTRSHCGSCARCRATHVGTSYGDTISRYRRESEGRLASLHTRLYGGIFSTTNRGVGRCAGASSCHRGLVSSTGRVTRTFSNKSIRLFLHGRSLIFSSSLGTVFGGNYIMARDSSVICNNLETTSEGARYLTSSALSAGLGRRGR